MNRAMGECHVCGSEDVEIHLLATCERCRAASGRFSYERAPGKRGRKAQARSSYPETFSCSFCGRPPREVRRLFTGPWTLICDGCVALAAEVMRDELGDDWHEPGDAGRSRRSTQEGRKTLSGHAAHEDEPDVTAVGPRPQGGVKRSGRRG